MGNNVCAPNDSVECSLAEGEEQEEKEEKEKGLGSGGRVWGRRKEITWIKESSGTGTRSKCSGC